MFLPLKNPQIQEQNESSFSDKANKTAQTLFAKSGKDYLLKRTLKKGCPKLMKMVNMSKTNTSRRRNGGPQPTDISFNTYSKMTQPQIPTYLKNIHSKSIYGTTATDFSRSTAAHEYSRQSPGSTRLSGAMISQSIYAQAEEYN